MGEYKTKISKKNILEHASESFLFYPSPTNNSLQNKFDMNHSWHSEELLVRSVFFLFYTKNYRVDALWPIAFQLTPLVNNAAKNIFDFSISKWTDSEKSAIYWCPAEISNLEKSESSLLFQKQITIFSRKAQNSPSLIRASTFGLWVFLTDPMFTQFNHFKPKKLLEWTRPVKLCLVCGLQVQITGKNLKNRLSPSISMLPDWWFLEY